MKGSLIDSMCHRHDGVIHRVAAYLLRCNAWRIKTTSTTRLQDFATDLDCGFPIE